MNVPVHRGEIYEGPDEQARYHYALFWMSDYHPGDPRGEDRLAECGQHFFSEMRPKYKSIKWVDKRRRSFVSERTGPYTK